MLLRLIHLQACLKHSIFLSRSISIPHKRFPMRVIPVPCRSDNYAYIVIDQSSNKAAVLDQYDVTKVVNVAKDAGVEIVGALTTHHHINYRGDNKVIAHLLWLM